jgi:hypothetical protein
MRNRQRTQRTPRPGNFRTSEFWAVDGQTAPYSSFAVRARNGRVADKPEVPQCARLAAADIAFRVAAYANSMTEDRIERALEDDYLSRYPSISKQAAYIRRTMELPALVSTTAQGFRPLILS